MSIRKFRASRISTVTASQYVGQNGDVFYDEHTGQFRVSDGHTAGGHIVQTTLNLTNGTADVFVNNLVVNGTTTTIDNIVSNNESTLTGVLTVTGNATFTGNTTINGPLIQNGPVTQTGTRTITGDSFFYGNTTFVGSRTSTGNIVNTGNVSYTGAVSFIGPVTHTGDTTFIGNVTEVGNLTITGKSINNGPSVFNGAMVITGDTSIVGNIVMTGNSNITGNTFVTGPTTVTGNVTITGNSLQTGRSIFTVPTMSSTQGAVEITGDANGLSQTPVNSGVMMHVTGQSSLPSRIYNDAQGNYSLFVGRRFEGTITSPTGVQGNVDIVRFGSAPYTSAGWANIGPVRMAYVTNEIQTATNQGGRIEFWTTANSAGPAYSTISRTATIDPALGVTAIGFSTSGNVVAGNVIANTIGTLTGNVNGTIMTAYQPNITSVGVLANLTVDGAGNGAGLTVQGNLRYDIAYGNGTVTQLTDKTTAVTCNGRTGQITTAASSIAKGAAVTFTVNNSYVTAVTDLPIVAIQSGATVNSYAIAVTRTQVGSFNITITNNGTGALADTIIINFAVMKIS